MSGTGVFFWNSLYAENGYIPNWYAKSNYAPDLILPNAIEIA